MKKVERRIYEIFVGIMEELPRFEGRMETLIYVAVETLLV